MPFAPFDDARRGKVCIFIRRYGMRNLVLIDKDDALPTPYPYLIGLKLKGFNRDRNGRLGSVALSLIGRG